MKKFILSIMAAALIPVFAMAQCPTPTTATATVTLKRKIPGLLDGNFSVSATKKVASTGFHFSTPTDVCTANKITLRTNGQ